MRLSYGTIFPNDSK